MKLKSTLIAVMCFLSFSTFSFAQPSQVKNGLLVQKAAMDWLDLLEIKEYARSWEAASSLFKQKVERRDWAVRVQGFRKSLGPLIERKLIVMQYGDPNDAWLNCTITYQTKFENRLLRRESVLLIYEENDWRVAGYYAH